ncbi:MAG: hypothetical protein LBK98_08205 [Peptococcaceae bacterium]|jgi:vacuolar-type H+-ATPase subunit H|nr:hypothetical protein [Peptococcaceae bacterium]
MENIIQELIRIEDQARRIVEQTEDEKKDLSRQIEANGEKIVQDIKTAAERQISLIREKCAGEARAEIARINEQKERRYLALAREFDARSGEWEAALFQSIIQ